MPEMATSVVHLLGPDVSAGRVAAVRRICSAGCGAEHSVVLVGEAVRRIPWPGALELQTPLNLPRFNASRIRRILQCFRSTRGLNDQIVLHVWSSRALPLTDVQDFRVVIEVETASAARDLPEDLPPGAGFVCSTAGAHEQLAARGVPGERRWLIRDAVDFAPIESAPRAALRARLDIGRSETAIAVLPPVTAAGGAEYAVWAALLLEKIRPDVRLIVPGRAEDTRRVRYLVRSCRHQHVLRLAEKWSVAELVAAADIAAFVPVADVPMTGLAWAMAAGRPIVASSIPAVRELLENGRTAWLCRPRDPRDGARCMLNALEQPENSERLARAAREKAASLFSPQNTLQRYGRVYAAWAPSKV